MRYDLVFNAQLETDVDDPAPPVLRYLQLGILDEHGFSGLVTDYCGGGEWGDLYYLHGQPIAPEQVDPDVEDPLDLEDDEYVEVLDRHYPQLSEALYARADELVEQREDPASGQVFPVALAALLALQDGDPERLISDASGLLTPVDGFHTTFEGG